MPDTTNRFLDKPTPPDPLIQSHNGHLGKLGPSDVAFYIDGIEEPLILSIAQEAILGRISPNNQTQPEVDLTPFLALEKGVSRLHAAIRRTKDGLTVKDLGSSNGTWVNDVRLRLPEFQPLSSGASLKLGRLELQIYFNSTAKSLPQEAENLSANSTTTRFDVTVDVVPPSNQSINIERDHTAAVPDQQLAHSSVQPMRTDVAGIASENSGTSLDITLQELATKQQTASPDESVAPLIISSQVLPPVILAKAQATLYQGTVCVDALTVFSQMGAITDELIRYLNSLPGCQVELQLEIKANCPTGFDESTIQTIRQLNDKLKFRNLQFNSISATP